MQERSLRGKKGTDAFCKSSVSTTLLHKMKILYSQVTLYSQSLTSGILGKAVGSDSLITD